MFVCFKEKRDSDSWVIVRVCEWAIKWEAYTQSNGLVRKRVRECRKEELKLDWQKKRKFGFDIIALPFLLLRRGSAKSTFPHSLQRVKQIFLWYARSCLKSIKKKNVVVVGQDVVFFVLPIRNPLFGHLHVGTLRSN